MSEQVAIGMMMGVTIMSHEYLYQKTNHVLNIYNESSF